MSAFPCSFAVSPAPTFIFALLADKNRIMKPEPDNFRRDIVITALWSGFGAKNRLLRLFAAVIVFFCLMPSLARAQATLLSEYRFDDVAWCTPVSALDTVGGRNGTLVGGVAWEDSPASGGKPVNGATTRIAGSGAIDITGLPFNLAAGAQNSVSFWMFWDGTNNVMPLGFGAHDLWLQGGSFGFNTFNSDIFGISSAGLAGGWHHVTAVFTNGNVTANKLWIDGVQQVLTQRFSTPNNANAVVSAHMRLSGVWGFPGYQFSGSLDVVRVYSGLITQAQVDADRALTSPAVVCPPPPPPTLVAHYRLDDNWDATHATANAVGGGPVGNFLTSYATKVATPAVSPNKPDTCSGAAFAAGNGPMRSTGVSLNLGSGAKNSVSFWMFWNGGDNQMPFGFARHDLWFQGGSFGFNSGASDIFGISSAGLANGWHHVAAVFTNANVADNKLWIDGVARVLTQRQSAPNNSNAYAANTFQLSGWTNDNNYRFIGRLDELKVYRGALTDAMVLSDYNAASCGITPPAPPANFNCVESGADASTGHLYTKLAGTAFSFDVAALKTDGTVEATYASDVNKPVTVELVDGSGATACASRTAISPAVSQTLTFAAANSGRKAAAAMTVNKAYANLRCRVTDANQVPSIVGCSADNFSVRPLSLQAASSANADGAGVSGTATPAVKAGASFSLTATALPGYDGTPKVDSSKLAAHGGAIQAGSLGGSFGAGNPGTGLATGNFAYSEVGYFNFAANGIYDDTYTAVDSAGDCTNDFSNSQVGGKYGCLFGNTSTTNYFGRFIPDHFTVVTPVPFAAGCLAGGFSYMDQPFSTPLSASIEARNTVNAKTRNYNGATFGKGTVSVQMENGNSGTPIPGTRLGLAGAPSWTSGAYAFTATRFSRPAAGVVDGAYDALDIGVLVTDSDNVYLVSRNMDASNTSCTADTAGTSDGTCTAVTLVAATRVRFGTLKLDNAYGSELLPLRVPLRAMYWNGTAWVTNTFDSCTTIPNQRNNFAIGNQQGTLTAGNYGATKIPAAALPLINGLGTLVLAAPNAGTSGGLDIALNLGATAGDANCIGGGFPAATAGASQAWLRGKWCGIDFTRDPNARVRFGSPKAPYIYLRERY